MNTFVIMKPDISTHLRRFPPSAYISGALFVWVQWVLYYPCLSKLWVTVVSLLAKLMVETKSIPLYLGNYGDKMKFKHPWFHIPNEVPVFCMSLHSFFLFLLIAWV